MLESAHLGDGAAQVEKEALRVLSRCKPPYWETSGGDAELVVGAVQSGKTLSFTALIAAARDNRFPLVVVLAGTKKNLRNQTHTRLLRDLEMAGDGGIPQWIPVKSPDAGGATEAVNALRRWATRPEGRNPTLVAVVLKNHRSIDHARQFLTSVATTLPDVPVLFVDDEGDQAGLNVATRSAEESSTYREIRRLREASPNHTYVLYTATPQAPLLISLEDTLSPRTVTVLESGKGYLGGRELFVEGRDDFVREITEDTVLDPEETSPPLSLERAVATFLLALVIAQRRGAPKPLTMLIHPSSSRSLHDAYRAWVASILHRITMSLEDGDPLLAEHLVEEVFAEPFKDLSSSGGTLADDGTTIPLDEIVAALRDEDLLGYIKIRIVNSEDGHEIDEGEWRQAPGWIVIGGNKLDRGFTVENLAITYMPRGPGVGNADTIQQRGRFFGYKASYQDLLRAWMTRETQQIYTSYVSHEEAMRSELLTIDTSGTPLHEWRRTFLLDQSLTPTRRQVIKLAIDTYPIKSGWIFTQTSLFTASSRTQSHLLAARQAAATPDARDRRPHHSIRNAGVSTSWSDVATLLSNWEGVPEDREFLYALILTLQLNPMSDAPVDLIFMNGGRTRSRRLGAESDRLLAVDATVPAERLSIGNLMQGAEPADGSIYPGDRHFRSVDTITVQVHQVSTEIPGRAPIVRHALAIHMPAALRDRLILQASEPAPQVDPS